MLKTVIVKLNADNDNKEISFTGVTDIERHGHRLVLRQQNGPVAEFDTAQVATWYAQDEVA